VWDIDGFGGAAFDARFFRIELVGMGVLGVIFAVALFVWFFALSELPSQMSVLVLLIGVFLGVLVPFYWNANHSVNNLGGLGRLLAGAPLSVGNGVLASIGALALMPRGRRALALVPVAGAVLVWLPVILS
jgi:predicted membrane-bound spermidine synthase